MLHYLSIRARIACMVTLALAALLCVSLIQTWQARDKFIEQRKNAAVSQVKMAISYFANLDAQVQAGELSIDEAQRLGRFFVNNSAVDESNYLYVYHKLGVALAHGINRNDQAARTEAELRALLPSHSMSREAMFERYGYYERSLTLPEIVARNNNGNYVGFAEYAYKLDAGYGYRIVTYWGDPLAHPEADHKLLYGELFEPWDWVVLRGILVDDVQAEMTKWTLNILAICALIVAVLAVGAWLISRSIIMPLRRATDFMEDIAQGSGDLTHRLTADGRDEISRLGHSFNVFVNKLETIIRQVLATNQAVSAKASELSTMIGRTASRSKAQLAETEVLASSTTELSASLSDVARNAQASVKSAEDVSDVTQRATAAVSRTKTTVEDLALSLTEMQSKAHVMRQHNDKVNSVIEVIRGIAEQTNLLALNAAIEAARAGEQGRGFAVVADEVRNLAQKTQASTHEINTIIEELQRNTDEVVSAMDGGVKRSEVSVEAANEANRLLQSAMDFVQAITNSSLEIAEAVRQQAKVTDEIAAGSVQIAGDGKLNTDDYKECQRVNEEVNASLQALQQLLTQFKLKQSS